MSQNKSLATLFQELGNDPETLAVFQANPNKFLSDLSPEDQEKLKSISTQLNIKASKNSPEFRATSNPLRDNDPIIPGDFYMGADDGGTIYQLYTTRDMPTFSGNSSYFSALIDPQGVANRLPVHEDKSDDFHELLKFDPSQDESEISNCFLAVKHFESPSNTYHIAEVKTLLLSVHKNAINPSKPYVIKASFDPSNHPQPGNVVFWVYVSKP